MYHVLVNVSLPFLLLNLFVGALCWIYLVVTTYRVDIPTPSSPCPCPHAPTGSVRLQCFAKGADCERSSGGAGSAALRAGGVQTIWLDKCLERRGRNGLHVYCDDSIRIRVIVGRDSDDGQLCRYNPEGERASEKADFLE